MNKFAQKIFQWIYYFLVVTCICLLSCDRDCSTNPKSEDKGYNFYTYKAGPTDDNSPWVYVWNSNEQKLTDSIFIDSGVTFTEVEVTADESHLLISNNGRGFPSRTRIIDLKSKQIIRELPYGGEIKVSPNGKYITIESQPFHVIDGVTFNEIMGDTLSVGGGAFDSSGNIYFAIRGTNQIYRYDIPNHIRLTDIIWTKSGVLSRLIPNAAGNKLFIHLRLTNQYGQIVVYDIASDSATPIHYTGGTPNVHLERTPDCRTILFTDPANALEALPTLAVHFIDIESEQVVVSVSYPVITGSLDSIYLNCTEIAVSPDGKTATFGSYDSPWQGAIDIQTHLFTDFWAIDKLNFGEGVSIACRKAV